MLCQHRFYVSLLLGGRWPGEKLCLRCRVVSQSCSGEAGTPARAAPAGRGRPPELLRRCRVVSRSCSGEAGSSARAAPARQGQGHPGATVWRILGALKELVIWGAVHLQASDAGEGIPPWSVMPEFVALSELEAIKKHMLNLLMKTTLKLILNMLPVYLGLRI
jgi:hypothetical protein